MSLNQRSRLKQGSSSPPRAVVNGVDVRRSYSICSAPAQLASLGTVEVGVKAVAGGAFSPRVQTLKAADTLQVLPPEGRFTLPADAKQLPASARYTETKSSITSAASTVGFAYDALGNLTQFTQSIAGATLETGKLTSYNANGAFPAGTSTTGDAVKHAYTPLFSWQAPVHIPPANKQSRA
jgi:hypothetical protein